MERSKLTKAHIISHILAVAGPSTRDELLRECARAAEKRPQPGAKFNQERVY